MADKYSPRCDGAECCDETPIPTCDLLDDNYNRTDNTDIGSNWVKEVGDAEIDTNRLLVNTNSSQIIATDPNPDGGNARITVKVTLSSSSSTARLFLGWQDSSNYLYATVTRTQITVGQTGGTGDGGSRTFVFDTPLTVGAQYSLEICFNGTDLVCRTPEIDAVCPGLIAPGDRFGVGCGTANVVFDDFVATKVGEDCDECTYSTTSNCSMCETGNTPRFWKVEISGAATSSPLDTGHCSSGCEDLNGTWIIDLENVDNWREDGSGFRYCGAEIRGPDLSGCPGSPSTNNGRTAISFYVAFANGFGFSCNFQSRVNFWTTFPTGPTPHVIGNTNWATGIPCASDGIVPCESEDLNPLVFGPTTEIAPCDFSGMTVSVEPL